MSFNIDEHLIEEITPNLVQYEWALNPLQNLILNATPPNERGEITMTHFCKLMGLTIWTVRMWINTEKIPANRVCQLLGFADGRVKLSDFHRFVYVLDE